MYTLIISTCIGLLVGYIYGLSFVFTQKRVFSLNQKNILFLSCIRLFFLGTTLYCLLQSTKTDFTLILISFIVAFWLVVYKKVQLNGIRPY